MKRPPATLGVLDWGIGGIGVVHALRAHNITLPIVYLSDTGVMAYGKLSSQALTTRVKRAIDNLQTRGATQVLVACNAASTVIQNIHCNVPVVGVIEPTLGAISKVPRDTFGIVGVIGGTRTIRSGVYRRGLLALNLDVVQRIAQPLSAHIEHGTIDSANGVRDLQHILKPLATVDTLVLACTHYPAIAARIQTHVPHARLIDPAVAVVRALEPQLAFHVGDRDLQLLCTGDAVAMRQGARRAWGVDLGACQRISL